VIQTVREKFSCRSCETITRPPAPFHPIARGRAGPDLLATIYRHLGIDHRAEFRDLSGRPIPILRI